MTFNYRVTPVLLKDSPAATPMGKLYMVEIEVWWWSEAPGESRRETGKLSFVTSRVVYIEE